jgi:hypothetical protein
LLNRLELSQRLIYIIQNVDRKLSLDDIAKAKGLTMEALLKEMEQIVYSGTKLNINIGSMKCLMTTGGDS